jgi:tetrahydromethanopterin S-methyltransferase subunit G
MTKNKYLTTARNLGIAVVAAMSLAACATKNDIRAINTRLDSIDAQVQSSAQASSAANAATNQRLDAIDSRVQALEARPGHRPRG